MALVDLVFAVVELFKKKSVRPGLQGSGLLDGRARLVTLQRRRLLARLVSAETTFARLG